MNQGPQRIPSKASSAVAGVHLRAFEKEDLDRIVRWVNDEAITRFLSDALIYPVSRADEARWLESVSMSNHRDKVFAVETEGHDLIGSIGLHAINWVERKAELGVMIGEKRYWNRGYGSAAVNAVLRIAFEKMNLNRVFLRVHENNTRAIRVYEKCGFQREGLLREDHYFGRRYYDTILMGMLRKEYLSRSSHLNEANSSPQGNSS
ncbi:MAG: GNAT family protein [Acidobacteriota bacterium]